ncbi:MAG: DoxX family membrane protein [Candidatus Woesearchaeota archaeon]
MIILRTLGEKLEYYSKAVLRIGISIVFLWLGVLQLTDSQLWKEYVPDIIIGIIANPELLVVINGTVHIVLGTLLLAGGFTRITAWALSANLIIILLGIGYDIIGILTLGMLAGTISIAMTSNDPLRIDNRIRLFRKKKDPISFD